MEKIKYDVKHEKCIPKKMTSGSAGHDVIFYDQWDTIITIPPFQTVVVPTGLTLELPSNVELEVRPRSGISKKSIFTHLGTIDSDYRGIVGVIMTNLSTNYFRINRFERIAQLVFSKTLPIEFEQVLELSKTERGENGFGSTGME